MSRGGCRAHPVGSASVLSLRRPRPATFVVGAVVIALVAGAVLWIRRPRDAAAEAAATRRAQAEDVAAEAGLPDDVRELIGRAAGVVGATFAVTYELGDGGVADVVQDPPRRRVDIRPAGASQPVTAVVVDEAGRTATCRQGTTWACTRQDGSADVTTGPFAGPDLERTISALAASRATYDFSVEDRRIAGVDASCLVTTRKAGAAADPTRGTRGELCVAPDGVPLLVSGGASTLKAVRYSTSVKGRTLDAPAELTSSGGGRG